MENLKADKEVLMLGQVSFISFGSIFLISTLGNDSISKLGIILITLGLVSSITSLGLFFSRNNHSPFYITVNVIEYVVSAILALLLFFTPLIHSNPIGSIMNILSFGIILGGIIIFVVRTSRMMKIEIFE